MTWREKPGTLLDWPSEIDYILSIDENGIPNLNNISAGNEWFTITGVLLNKDQFVFLKDEVTKLKFKYWKEGVFKNKRVVLHSRDIRKKIGPFNPKLIDYEGFTSDLQLTLKKMEYQIFSSSINRKAHISQYARPYPVYNFCLEFILERFAMYLENYNKKGLVVVESRGAKENRVLLRSAISVIDNGNRFMDSKKFNGIKGVYFNPKRTINKKMSFPQLEIADLVGYEIYKYIRDDEKSFLFKELEKSLYNYPDYVGYGMKTFP